MNRILREPALILGLVTAFFGMANLLGWLDLTVDQMASVSIFVGALVAFLRFLTTPSSEVVAAQRGSEPVKAGAKAENDWGLVQGSTVKVDAA